MKKLLCCLLGILLLLNLAGCRFFSPGSKPSDSQVTEPSTAPTQRPTEPDTSEPVVIGQMPLISISLPTSEETITADDGTVLFRHIFQEVVLTTGNASVTDAVTLDLLRRIDTNISSLNGLISAAKASYTPGQEGWSSYFFEVQYTPTRIDAAVLSLNGTESSYAGSGNPSSTGVSVNYSMSTGQVLTLADVLCDTDGAADALCRILLETLGETAEENALFDDYADVIGRRFQADLQQDGCWYFTEEGLCFFFHPYDIAPYSSGTIHTLIPYSRLGGILADTFIPAGKPDTEGKLLAVRFEDADLNSFDSFSELILDAGSDTMLLYTDGILLDVTLEQGYWDSKTNSFASVSTVFAANCLSPGKAFVLQAPLSNTTPTLLLRCRADGRDAAFFILEDIQTGGILLLAANG